MNNSCGTQQFETLNAQTSSADTTSIVWFRNDLRLTDNSALAAAAAEGNVVALYVVEDPNLTGVRAPGGASNWWLDQSLRDLATRLDTFDIPLLTEHGDPRLALPQLANDLNATFVAWSERYHEPQRSIDSAVKERLETSGIPAHEFPGHLLLEPWNITNGQGNPYKVFTPFGRKLMELLDESADLAVATQVGPNFPLSGTGSSLDDSLSNIDALNLVPSGSQWPDGLQSRWTPGEVGAQEQFQRFITTLLNNSEGKGYAEGRDIPALKVTSSLSPHLSFGEISPRFVWHSITRSSLAPQDSKSFLSELMWRDFAWHRLFHRPDLATANVRAEFNHFDWLWDSENNVSITDHDTTDPRTRPLSKKARHQLPVTEADQFEKALNAWRAGTTGIPLVNAGMRELWATGHMHNRVRMLVASFLTKNLGIHWRHGEAWFWQTLVDADPASNAFNWQWAAGCGDDASPYFRIFNPEVQAKKFDPDGIYLSRWVPELNSPDYPQPLVDLKESRTAALEEYDRIKSL